jgi:hypothetical protein
MAVNVFARVKISLEQALQNVLDFVNHALRVNVLNGATPPSWDYAALTQGSSPYTDTWVFKSGGSGGTTLRTILITYTDSTRDTISTVALS